MRGKKRTENYIRVVEKLSDDIMERKDVLNRGMLSTLIYRRFDTFLECYFKEMANMQKKLEYLNSLHKEDEMDEVIHEILEEQEYENLYGN